MSRTVLLARHAHHDEIGIVLSGRSNIGLSARGVREADALGDNLTAIGLGAIYSSPRRRTLETADRVAIKTGIAVEVCEALDEIDFGVWTGRRFDELVSDRAWRLWNEDRSSACTPAGDTMAAIVDRVRIWLASLAYGAPILCVTHADVIRGVVAQANGLPFNEIFRFTIEPASMVTIEVDDAGALRLPALAEHTS